MKFRLAFILTWLLLASYCQAVDPVVVTRPWSGVDVSGCSITADSHFGAYVEAAAVDGYPTPQSLWDSDAGYPHWLALDCATARAFNGVGFLNCFGGTDCATSASVYYSDDGVAWGSAVGSIGSPSASSDVWNFVTTTAGTHQYIKLQFDTGPTYAGSGEWLVYGPTFASKWLSLRSEWSLLAALGAYSDSYMGEMALDARPGAYTGVPSYCQSMWCSDSYDPSSPPSPLPSATFDLLVAQSVQGVALQNVIPSTTDLRVTVETSTDDAIYTAQITTAATSYTDGDGNSFYMFPSPVTARYVKVELTSAAAGSQILGFGEFNLGEVPSTGQKIRVFINQ